MLLDRFLDDVYVPLRLRGRSQNSVRLLRHAIRQFGLFLGRPPSLDDLDDLTVSRFLLNRADKVSRHSVARERSGLVAMWNLAQARGLIRLRPALASELLPERTPRAFSEDELQRLAAAAGEARGFVGPIRASDFFPALLATAFESGERINALLTTPRDCWRRPTLIVPAEHRKGGRSERVYDLSPETADLVDAAAAHNGPTAFWWPYSTTALYKRWHTITRRAGLGDGRDVQFHAIRRSTASHLAAAGADATAHLGHSSDRITRRSYLDPRIVNANRPKVWQLLPRIAEMLRGPENERAG